MYYDIDQIYLLETTDALRVNRAQVGISDLFMTKWDRYKQIRTE